MNLKETMSLLESLGKESKRKHYRKHGVGDNQFGVNAGDLKKIAKSIKTNHSLGTQLWDTDILDARMLAILIIPFKEKSLESVDKMAKEIQYDHVSDWFAMYALKEYPEKETLRLKWIASNDIMPQRIAWQMTSGAVSKKVDYIQPGDLLDTLEKEMLSADPKVQWTMNFTLANIGIHHAEHRARAISLGEKFGLYRDYPVPKGCTSPFAPIWIDAIVSRQS